MRMRSDQSHVKSLEPGKQQNPIPRRVVLVDIGKEGPPSSLVTLLNGARLIQPWESWRARAVLLGTGALRLERKEG